MTCKHIVSAVLAASLAARADTITTTGDNVTMTTLPDRSPLIKFLSDGTFTLPAGATG